MFNLTVLFVVQGRQKSEGAKWVERMHRVF